MWLFRRINNFETFFWALGGQSKHSLEPDSVAQLQAMRDLVTPATLAWEREGDLEAQGKEKQSWRDVALAFWQSTVRENTVITRSSPRPFFCNRLRDVQGGGVGA